MRCRALVLALAWPVLLRVGAPACPTPGASSLSSTTTEQLLLTNHFSRGRATNFVEGGEWTQFYLKFLVLPFFASIYFSFFAAVFHYLFFFFPVEVFSPPLPDSFLTASPNPVTFVFKCSNLPCSRGLRSRVNKSDCVFSIQLNCTFTVDILL